MAKLLFDATELERCWRSTMHCYQKLSIKALSLLESYKTTLFVQIWIFLSTLFDKQAT